ncbi:MULTISPECIES: GntR family transcriptional regulator [unclassified Streptomyces]|uniref:GntR family transcriptional regulator n=1 Tax=unclassified Streptomyces TaxID=2593676 RepID=UPI000DAB88C3|nr:MULTISPECIES: UTRA domain-containing protein [unclassified Streptomyces]PZT72204.1 UTRA domain-containing protein [Streptomyces sp. AC1-42T]PZT81475.1 UTRA domain-containing protein [Streptomyces sp. AC1-42W]
MGGNEWVSTSTPYLAASSGAPGDTWAAEAAAEGRRGSQRVVQAGEVAAPELVAELLGVAAGENVVARRRIMYLDGEPCELTDTYYPLGIAGGTGLAGTAKIPGGAVRLLVELGHVGVRVREEVTARRATGPEVEQLGLAEGDPVLQLTRLTLDEADRPIQVDVMVMPPQRQKLRYEIRIG